MKDPKITDKSKALDEAINAEDKQIIVETHRSVRDGASDPARVCITV